MKKDFRFLFPRAEDELWPYKLNVLHSKIEKLKNEYCINYFDTIDNVNNDFLNEINFYKKDSLLVQCKLLGGLISPLLNKKQDIFSSLLLQHNQLKRQYRKLSALRVSFNFPTRQKLSPEIKMSMLATRFKKFLNNIRHRPFYKIMVGYFWVILRDKSGMPYIHANFYIDGDDFTSCVGHQINSVWFRVTGKSEGGNYLNYVCHFTASPNYSNAELMGPPENLAVEAMMKDTLGMILDDFNYSTAALVKFAEKANKDQNSLSEYLFCLAKESFCLLSLKGKVNKIQRGYKHNQAISDHFHYCRSIIENEKKRDGYMNFNKSNAHFTLDSGIYPRLISSRAIGMSSFNK